MLITEVKIYSTSQVKLQQLFYCKIKVKTFTAPVNTYVSLSVRSRINFETKIEKQEMEKSNLMN